MLYVRDEDSAVSSGVQPPLPYAITPRRYIATHGQGYSRFEHSAHGIDLNLLMYVPLSDPIKISRLRLHNRSDRRRRLSVTAYIEWVSSVKREPPRPRFW